MSDNPGIYGIRNLFNDKIYVGSGLKCQRRLTFQINALRRGDHISKHLQSAWNKYGEEWFSWEILERTAEDDRFIRETWWIDHFRANDRKFGYNKAYPARAQKPSKQMSEVHRAYWASLSPKERTKRLDHFLNPDKNPKAISKTMLRKWRSDPEYRAARLAGLDRGRAKTNANPTPRQLEVLSGGRAKAIKNNKTPKARKNQAANSLAQWDNPRIKAIRLEALTRGRNKTNARKRANAAARRAGNDIV